MSEEGQSCHYGREIDITRMAEPVGPSIVSSRSSPTGQATHEAIPFDSACADSDDVTSRHDGSFHEQVCPSPTWVDIEGKRDDWLSVWGIPPMCHGNCGFVVDQ